MKRLFALLLTLALVVGCLAVPAGAIFDPSPVYDVKAQSAYIVNTDTNIIVYEKDSTAQMPAGGLTKLMCAALVLTNYGDELDSRTFQMPFAISDYVYGTDNADMRSGETFTLREALYAMLLRNANDAAMGMAYQLSGNDLAGWVSQMNSLSQQIGTTASTWTDACGLDPGNVTNAVDMYLILRALLEYDAFVEALQALCVELAKQMASDGEGATHLITCTVTGAKSEESAEIIAKSVISSTLTKAAIFGCDANWGRVLCAMGYSGEKFDPDKVDVAFASAAGEIPVCRQGRGLDFDEDLAKRILTEDEVEIRVRMGEGDASCTCWGCDITYDYIKINGDYRT